MRFRRVLDLAVDNGVLVREPGRPPPQARRQPHPPRRRLPAPPPHQDAAWRGRRRGPDDLDALVILFLAYTGVRAAELCGLNVGDVRRGTLYVRRTRKRTGGAWVEDTPKSAKSTRRVPLPRGSRSGWPATSPSTPAPRTRTRRCSPGATRAATPTAPATRKTGPPAPPTGRSRSSRACSTRTSSSRRSGRPGCRRRSPRTLGVRLHDLRHTFATMALDDGHDYREVSRVAGARGLRHDAPRLRALDPGRP